MCVVTLLPIAGGFLMTVNRDEHTSRPAAVSPQTHSVNNRSVVFPKDPQGGGTWLAASETQLVCLLNGAFPADKPRPSRPKKSRGQVVLDTFNYDDPYQFADQYDFGDVAPFTLIIAGTDGLQQAIFELRWNGQQVWVRDMEVNNPHIWSSFTLYDAETMALRKGWFAQFLRENHTRYTPDMLFSFHQTAGDGDATRDFVMSRPADGVRTVSITQVAYTNRIKTMHYLDLPTGTETQLKF